MGLLQTLGKGQGHLKAGFLGFAGSGKTRTATDLAIGVRELFGLSGPIAFFDTEGGVEYLERRIFAATGQAPVGLKSRSLADLIAVTKECEEAGVSVLIVDSVTHIWREVCESALGEINAQRKRWSKKPITKLEFQHWGPIKLEWAKWTDLYLNARLHIVICGRAGYEYDFQPIDDSEKKELVKTGVKMKTESEFGFEPSLLVEMERVDTPNGVVRRATVLKDRYDVMDGASCDNPTFDFWLQHVECLKPGVHAPIDLAHKTSLGMDQDGDAEWQRERRQRQIFAEEIQALLVEAHPGQTAKEKKAKADLIRTVFNTGSWTKVEGMRATDLEAGLVRLRSILFEQSTAAMGADATPPAVVAGSADVRQPPHAGGEADMEAST